jgi:hypothetical protein
MENAKKEKHSFTKEQREAIAVVCDIALKAGGLGIYPKVTVVLSLLRDPISKDE